jgi:hypothetical protein
MTMIQLLLQVISLLGALAVIAVAVPVSAIEESYSHIAIAPALEISHAPLAIAHAPVIKEVEHHVSITLLALTLCKQWVEMESLFSSRPVFLNMKRILLFLYSIIL